MTSEAGPAQVPETVATPRWFAVWTRSRHEHAVFEQLTERGIDAFLPTTPRWSRWKDRKKKIDWPLFPGYCFARFPPAGRLPVLKCAGVVSIVSFNGELAPVPDDAIEGIRALVNSALPCDPCPMLKTGMRVEVVHGPLKGVVGRLQRKGSQARLVLSVDLIGRGVSVQVDAADVRAL
jgi:transcriptional antiterminator NusG